ncbi:Hsp20/alpha crystallin family protein [Hazenella coriacea]|uniref:Hsp20/alpha crystallin family protein n=1 Tax=Hazenella coriacea TaxID=1179467 RepID=UPI00104DD403|nr:Hsp20/alpha crystallin family protein [Hazenella coriacea]
MNNSKNSFDFTKWNQLARQFLGEDFFQDMMDGPLKQGQGPYADVYQGQNEVIVVIDLPGMEDINSLDIRVEGALMKIKGFITSPYQGYPTITTERQRGEFEKTINLGNDVSNKYTSARYRKGVLEIRLPKLEVRQQAKKIKINAQD